MKKRVVVLGLVAVMVLGAVYAYAQGPGFGPGHRRMYEFWGPEKENPLTPEQQTKFQELRQKFNDETAQLRGAIYTKRLELQSLWSNPKADPKAILEKEKELGTLRDQLRDKAIRFKLEARNVLPPEQLAQFGSGWGMGPGFGYGHRMGRGYGRGWGDMGPGYGMGRGYGCY
jgi:Spy/CpxP family protein refolding chaperone